MLGSFDFLLMLVVAPPVDFRLFIPQFDLNIFLFVCFFYEQNLTDCQM